MALHGVLDLLGTETVSWVLVHCSIHCHHVVHAVVLKPMASKEEECIHVLAKERGEVLYSLQGVRKGLINKWCPTNRPGPSLVL